MRNITITVDDAVYRRARKKAAAEETSVSRVVQRFLTQWAGQDEPAALMARLERLFAEADARDRNKPGSAGPFSRDELYADRLDRFS
jgi:predicted CopG family antitoxin